MRGARRRRSTDERKKEETGERGAEQQTQVKEIGKVVGGVLRDRSTEAVRGSVANTDSSWLLTT
jgi:hypothetical protein